MLKILTFGANWCKACYCQSRILDEIKNEYGNRIEIEKVDIEKESHRAEKYFITSLPRTYLLNDMGYILEQGVDLVSKDIIRHWIETYR